MKRLGEYLPNLTTGHIIAFMADSFYRIARAGLDVLQSERFLAGDFIPAGRNPLPQSATAWKVTDRDKSEQLNAIDRNEVRVCDKCRLHQGRTQTVFGEGNPDADLVFIGEGPGQEEDRTGRPFVGRAGKLLDKMIAAMGLDRKDVFICNLVKCRAPNNRTPAPDEVRTCCDLYLTRQLSIIAPKVIVTLGGPATQHMLNTSIGITKLRGRWSQLPIMGENLAGIDVMPTFHPAYLLRQYTTENRRKVWSDLQEVMKFLNLAGSNDRP